MRIPENMRFRLDLAKKKLSGQMPSIGWSNVQYVLKTSGIKMQDDYRILDRDEKANLVLWQFEKSMPPVWYPVVADLNELDHEPWLELVDFYHGAYIGDIVPKDAVVIDCGGYAGLFSRWAFSKGAKQCVIFEPEPKNQECIRRNLLKEIASGQVLIIEAAVSDRLGTMEFFLDVASTGNTLNADLAHNKRKLCGSRTIDVTTIDNQMQALDIRDVALIKMDIEGAERDALTGAAETLARFKPNLAICTYHLPDDHDVLPARVRSASLAYGTDIKHFYHHPRIDIWRNPARRGKA